MIGWYDWLDKLAKGRTIEHLSPEAVALRVIHSPYVDRFGLKRLEAWLGISDWDDWAGAPTGNAAEEYVKRCGLPLTEGFGAETKFIPGCWRGGNWVRNATAAPETDVTREQAAECMASLLDKF